MVEPLATKLTKRKLFGILFLIFIILAPIVGYFYYNMAINRPSPLDKEITFEIKNGEGIAEIGKNLYQANAVNSEFLFSLYVFLNKLDTNIQAGSFVIRAGTPLKELVEQFQHGVNDARVTFIEGWRVEEYARLVAQQFEKINYAEFVRQAQPYEGYLFPDTYYFEKEVQEEDLIAILRETFQLKTQDLLTDANLQKANLTREQAVILASIVEREVSSEEDRPIVAGILHNRLHNGMLLGADATTQYAVAEKYLCGSSNGTGICATPLEEMNQFNWWPNNLTQEDLDSDSPFNTRKVVGLPPHPISNPSLSALDAVINYQDTDYEYYLTDDQGVTHYAKTLEEHNANVEEFLR